MYDRSTYLRKPYNVLAGALLLTLAIPLAVLYFDGLGNLPLSLRAGATVTIVSVLIAGFFLFVRYLHHFRSLTVIFILAVPAVTMVLKASGDDSQSTKTISTTTSILYSDGSLVSGVLPANTNLWGRTVAAYGLHPPYDSVRVPETLIAQLRPSLSVIRVLVSKPLEAMFLPDGSPTDSDGISLDMQAKGDAGQILAHRLMNITQEEFLAHRWITLELFASTAISEITIKVTSGALGSTPTYDSTLLVLQAGGMRSELFDAGVVVLSGLLAFVLALCGAGILSLISASVHPRHWRFPLRLTWSPLIFGTCLLAIVYWSVSQTSYIYYWDYRNYWGKTEYLYELITSGYWATLASVISESYSNDYTMFPALPTAIFASLFGYPSRLAYAISISLLYAIPAYLITAYIADKLFIGTREKTWAGATPRLAAAFAILFGTPLYLGVALNLMPDIGGVFIAMAAMFLACNLSRTIGQGTGRMSDGRLHTGFVNASIGLGILLGAMFLFRRWYVFSAVGIVLAGLLTLGYDLLRQRQNRSDVLRTAVWAIVLIATASLSILSWVMFDRASKAASHDYASLYAAYSRPLWADLDHFLSQFGIVAPALSILLIVLSPFFKIDRQLLFFVTVPSIIGTLLFLQVQSPSLQHFYLLMPLIGIGIAGISSILTRFYAPAWGFAFAGVLLIGALGATVKSPYQAQFSRLFPPLDSWMPKKQAGHQGLVLLGDWLVSPEIRSSRFCVLASSVVINQSIVSELWQIIPSLDKHELALRMISLGDVDSRDGPPSRALDQCEIVLVGTPPQTHLGMENQYSVVIPAQDLISCRGIGTAYEWLPMSFRLDDQTEIVPFRRVRHFAEDEYQDLLKRFYELSEVRNPSVLSNFERKPQT